MAITLAQLRDRARVKADMIGDQFRTDLEIEDKVRNGIRALWADVTSVNKDFRVNTSTFTLTSTNSVTLPSDFREVRFVIRDYGLQSQEILNKLGARAGQNAGERSYRLQDRSLYIEPLLRAAGNYTLLYTPLAPVLASPDRTVRLVTQVNDLMAGAYTTSGTPGVGRTITSTAPGSVLTIDGRQPALGDRFLLTTSGVPGPQTNGIWAVSQLAATGVPWKAVRATDSDESTEVWVNQTCAVTDGFSGAGTLWQQTFVGFVTIDGDSQVWTQQAASLATLDAELEQHEDYIETQAAIELKGEDEDDTDTLFRLLHGVPGTNETGIRGRVMRWASDQRSADPDRVEDVRTRRRTRDPWF